MRTIQGASSDCSPLPTWGRWDLTRAFLRALESGDMLAAQWVSQLDYSRRERGIPSIWTFDHVRKEL